MPIKVSDGTVTNGATAPGKQAYTAYKSSTTFTYAASTTIINPASFSILYETDAGKSKLSNSYFQLLNDGMYRLSFIFGIANDKVSVEGNILGVNVGVSKGGTYSLDPIWFYEKIPYKEGATTQRYQMDVLLPKPAVAGSVLSIDLKTMVSDMALSELYIIVQQI